MKTHNMRQRRIAKLAFLLLGAGLMVVGQPAGAISIYSETFVTPSTATQSDTATNTKLANDFVPVTNGTITEVVWQGMYNSGATVPLLDDFTIGFYADNDVGSVGSQIASFSVVNSVERTATGDYFGNSPFYSYRASLGPGVAVLEGATYWISIMDSTASPGWWWAAYTEGTEANPYNGPGEAPSYWTGTSWVSYGYDYKYYFELSGDAPAVSPVPLPPTIALILPGLALLGFVARRRK